MIMAVHSDGERMDVRRKAPGTFGTSCRAGGVVGGLQTSGEDGSDVDRERGMAFGDEA